MNELFQFLTEGLERSPTAALSAAFAWGVVSVLLSPCHLAGIPLIIAYVNDQQTRTARHAAWLSTLFALGMLATIAAAGLVTAVAGRALGDLGSISGYVVSVVFLLIGLDMVDAITLPWFGARKEQVHRKGVFGAFMLGLIFGMAAGPCTFAFLAPVFAVSFHTASAGLGFSMALLLLFGLGHCSVLILAGTSAERALRFAQWNRETSTAMRLRKGLGVLLILTGLYLLYKTL